MNINLSDPVSAALSLGKDILDRFVPDKAAAAKAKEALEVAAQSGELEQMRLAAAGRLAQASVDKVEAASSDTFERDWRPAVGWICAAALGYDFVVRPLLTWGSNVAHLPIPPELDLSTMLPLLAAMLGVRAIPLKGATK